jgi:hypothetical protein
MDTLSAIEVVSNGSQQPYPELGYVNFPNFTFAFGKSYLLDGWPWHGGHTLSWIIGGAFNEFKGKLLKNNLPYTIKERKKDAWRIRNSSIPRRHFFFREPTVQAQILYGLKTAIEPYFKTEKEFIERFHLSIERYQRPLRTFSGEGWRASAAIGLAIGRKIFCYPYVRPDITNMYSPLFKETFEVLTDSGALVLFPTTAVGLFHPEGLCDEIVPVKHDSGDVILYGRSSNASPEDARPSAPDNQ